MGALRKLTLYAPIILNILNFAATCSNFCLLKNIKIQLDANHRFNEMVLVKFANRSGRASISGKNS